jgi:hypothetical protein
MFFAFDKRRSTKMHESKRPCRTAKKLQNPDFFELSWTSDSMSSPSFQTESLSTSSSPVKTSSDRTKRKYNRKDNGLSEAELQTQLQERKIRNKLSAQRFRNRRKEILQSQKTEIDILRKRCESLTTEIENLKRSNSLIQTMLTESRKETRLLKLNLALSAVKTTTLSEIQ